MNQNWIIHYRNAVKGTGLGGPFSGGTMNDFCHANNREVTDHHKHLIFIYRKKSISLSNFYNTNQKIIFKGTNKVS